MSAYNELYRIIHRNLSKYDPKLRMPFTEAQVELVAKLTDVHVIDLATVIDLPQMEFVNALYALFQYRTNDRYDDWKKLANAVGEDEFKQKAINLFISSDHAKTYGIEVLNNPYEQKGTQVSRFFKKK